MRDLASTTDPPDRAVAVPMKEGRAGERAMQLGGLKMLASS